MSNLDEEFQPCPRDFQVTVAVWNGWLIIRWRRPNEFQVAGQWIEEIAVLQKEGDS